MPRRCLGPWTTLVAVLISFACSEQSFANLGIRYTHRPYRLDISWQGHQNLFAIEFNLRAERRTLLTEHSRDLFLLYAETNNSDPLGYLVDSGHMYIPLRGGVVLRVPPFISKDRWDSLRVISIEGPRTATARELYSIFFDESLGVPIYVLQLAYNPALRGSTGIVRTWTIPTTNSSPPPIHYIEGPTAFPYVNALARILSGADESLPDRRAYRSVLLSRFATFDGWVLNPPYYDGSTFSGPYQFEQTHVARHLSDSVYGSHDDVDALSRAVMQFNLNAIRIDSSGSVTSFLPEWERAEAPRPRPHLRTEPVRPPRFVASLIYRLKFWPNHYIYALTNGLVAIIRSETLESSFQDNQRFVTTRSETLRSFDSDLINHEIVYILTLPHQNPGPAAASTVANLLDLDFEPPGSHFNDLPELTLKPFLEAHPDSAQIAQENATVQWRDRHGQTHLFNVRTGERAQNRCSLLFRQINSR